MSSSREIPNSISPTDFSRSNKSPRESLEICSFTGDLNGAQTILKVWTSQKSQSSFTLPDLTSSLNSAVIHGHLSITRLLLDHGAPITAATNAIASREDKPNTLSIFEAFLEHGWSVNSTVKRGPMVMCLIMSHLDGEALLRWFLEHGGSANGVPSDPGAPLRRARTPAMAALLLKHGATLRYTSALHAATLRDSDSEAIPLMQFLLENVVDIDELQYEGRHNRPREAGSNDHGTALHVAAKEGSVERARMLAESGADMGKRSKNGFTARDGAQLREKDEVKLFLEGCMREKGLEVKELIEEDYNDEYGDGIRNVR